MKDEKEVKAIIARVAEEYPDDIDAAVDAAAAEIRKRDSFEFWQGHFWRMGLRKAITDRCHTINQEILRKIDAYFGPAKVRLDSPGIQKLMEE
jgi:hypothetical protein